MFDINEHEEKGSVLISVVVCGSDGKTSCFPAGIAQAS